MRGINTLISKSHLKTFVPRLLTFHLHKTHYITIILEVLLHNFLTRNVLMASPSQKGNRCTSSRRQLLYHENRIFRHQTSAPDLCRSEELGIDIFITLDIMRPLLNIENIFFIIILQDFEQDSDATL
jgi:hypothetical protein